MINIFGDSFGADHNNENSWTRLLAEQYPVKNYCIPGSSEYRILNCIRDNVPTSGLVILVHTNPYRVFVEDNPLHQNSKHKNCDLVISDLEYYQKTEFGNAAMNYFKYLFSEKMFDDFYDMCIQEECKLLDHCNVIHTTHFDTKRPGIFFNYNKSKHKGTINHYNIQGNQQIYRQINKEVIKYLHV